MKSSWVRLSIVAFKFVSGVAEVVTGAALVVIPHRALGFLLRFAATKELNEDPSDRIALLVQHHLPELLRTQGTIAAALIVVGVVKIVGAAGLLLRKAWGYYLLLIIMVLLVPLDVGHAIARRTGISVGLALLNLFILAALLLLRGRLVASEEG